jgi:hypothetical protein
MTENETLQLISDQDRQSELKKERSQMFAQPVVPTNEDDCCRYQKHTSLTFMMTLT